MATIVNKGSQRRAFYFQQPLSSFEFSQIFSRTLPTGIYEGGEIEYRSGDRIRIAPMTVVIGDSGVPPADIALRIRTTELIGNTVGESILRDPTRPLFVCRYSWEFGSNPGEGFMEFAQVSETRDETRTIGNQLWATDLILGKFNFIWDEGEGDYILLEDDPIDYTRKSWATVVNPILRPSLEIRAPYESDTDKRKVRIVGGYVQGKNSRVQVDAGVSEFTVSDTVGTANQGRTDYIYLNEHGEVKLEEGVIADYPAPTKPFFGRKVLALIQRKSGRNSIRGSEIIQTHLDPIATIQASTLTIEDDGNYYSGDPTTIESALQQAWEKIIEAVVTEHKTFRNSAGTTFQQAGNRDGIIIRGSDSGSGHNITIKPQEQTMGGNPTLILNLTGTQTATIGQGTMVSVEHAQTITGLKTFRNTSGTTFRRADNQDGIILQGRGGGTANRAVTITVPTLGSNRTLTLADEDTTLTKGTMASTAETQALSNKTYNGLSLTAETDGFTVAGGTTSRSLRVQSGNIVIKGAGKEIVQHQDIVIGASSTYTGKVTITTTATGDGTVRIPSGGTAVLVAGTMVPTTRTVAGKELSGNITLDTLSVGTTSSHGSVSGGSYNGSSSTSITLFKPNQDLNTTSAVTFSTVSAGSFDVTSARSKKDHINTFNGNAIDLLNKIEIVTFSYKDDPDQREHIGMIADDIPWQFASLDRTGVSLPDTVSVLIKAVQELSQEVKELKRKIGE